MISDAQLRALAIFFYFAFQDERLAEMATTKAIAIIKSRKKDGVDNGDSYATLVFITNRIWQEYKKTIRSTQSAVSQLGGWLVPTEVDLGPWRQFRKESPDDEFLVIIWSQISKIPDESISRGLGITIGTVRHRIARGLKRLGSALV